MLSLPAPSSVAGWVPPGPNEWGPGWHRRVPQCHDLARLYFHYDDGLVFEICFCRAVHITQCARCAVFIKSNTERDTLIALACVT